MKKFAMLAVIAGGLCLTTGCGTPGLTTEQRGQEISRNAFYDYEQISDDLDHIFLLTPTQHLSEWNLQ
jgi:hypothetical protein